MFHPNLFPPHRTILLFLLTLLVILLATSCEVSIPEITSIPKQTPTSTPVSEPLPPSPSDDEEPIAILTQVEGEVILEQATAGRAFGLASLQGGRQASPFQLLYTGTVLRSTANARASAVCLNNRYFRTAGATTVRVAQQCQSGTRLPNPSLSRVKPDAGRIRVNQGTLRIEGPAREKEGDYGRIPIVLSSRNTSLLDLEPELRWVEVSGAIEYVLSLSGSVSFDDIVLDVEALSCLEDPMTSPNRVCVMPWPASEWHLDRGRPYFLTVSARTGIASPLRESEKSVLRTLDEDTASEAQTAVADVQALDLDAVTQDLLLAGLYAEQRLYQQAIAAYKRVLDEQPSPVVYVTLGDTYRKIELYRWAFDAYQKAQDRLSETEDDLTVRAAAAFGIGQVYFAYADNYAEAAKHYAEAVRLYEQLDAGEALEAAQMGVEEARKRSP